MTGSRFSRRQFLGGAGAFAGLRLTDFQLDLPFLGSGTAEDATAGTVLPGQGAADYTLAIKASPIEIAPKRIISSTTYNGQFPGPLLRFKEGRQVTVDIFNDTDTPEQLHWHGQRLPTDVDGAAEEGTPLVPAHGKRRITFTPGPAGLRFYHTHNRAGADLYAGQYGGQVGPVYIEPASEAGRYDRELFLVLKEFEPMLSRGGDMPRIFSRRRR